MSKHAPDNYNCPICLGFSNQEAPEVLMRSTDVFYQDDLVIAFIGSKSFDNNPGHVVVAPIKHYENIYDLPKECGHRVFELSQRISVMLKSLRECDGITILQNNEPAGGQHCLHYHLHILPRFKNDDVSKIEHPSSVLDPSERQRYAEDLKSLFS